MITIHQIDNPPKGVTTVYALFRDRGVGQWIVCSQSFGTLKMGAEVRKREASEKNLDPQGFDLWFFDRTEAMNHAKKLNEEESKQ